MRYRTKPNPAAFLFGVLCFLVTGVLSAAPFEGRIVRSDGQVSVTGAQGQPIDLSAAGNVVREEQTISTGPNGMAVVRFNNGSITVLDPNSRLQVKTPNWFVHLAGKAFFAFKKLVGAADERRVQNTVALIGIRGTEFISYETDQTAVALDEGSLNLQTLGNAFQLDEDGAQSSVAEFVLDEKEMVTFDGTAATITAFTPAVLADFAAFKTFGGDLLGDFSVDYTPDLTAAAETPEAAAAAAAATTEEEAEEQETAEAAAPETAGGPGFYLGVGYGLSKSDTDQDELERNLIDGGSDIGSIEYDDESTAAKVFAGYYFTNNFGVEVGYTDLGEFESTIGLSASSTQTPQEFADNVAEVHPVSAEGVYAAGVLRLNLFLFSIVAKAGVYAWEGEVEAAIPAGVSADTESDGTDPMVALGVDLPILPIRVEVEHYELDDDAVDVISANLVFQF